MRSAHFPFTEDIKSKTLHWAAQFPYAVFLDSCDSKVDQYGKFDFLSGAVIKGEPEIATDLAGLKRIWNTPSYKFGILSYELKNETEKLLSSKHPLFIPFPVLKFFVADVVIGKAKASDDFWIEANEPEKIFEEITGMIPALPGLINYVPFQSDIEKEDYIQTIHQLRNHIREGDCYEINFCRHFFGNGKLKSPAAVFEKLITLSPAPFAGFARMNDVCLLSASPERFLKKSGKLLLTQPMKGTAPRGKNQDEDEMLVHSLRNSVKEQAENVMIVDLSRNDLYKSCEINSVEISQLFEVQTFAQVHQLVSTISGKLGEETDGLQAVLNLFPPGSMTGAPKFRVCQLADEYERSSRGIYSGCLGYVSPEGNFDFNVIIRSIVYEEASGKISFHTGGAITWDSVPEKEWEETLLKSKAITELFGILQGL